MSRYYDLTNANPPTYDSSPAAIARFWEDFHSASPAEKANFIRRHPGTVIPDPIAPRTTYADSSPLTFLPDDHRYQNQTFNVAAETAARDATRKQKLDVANAELQRQRAIAQAKIDERRAEAPYHFRRYHDPKEPGSGPQQPGTGGEWAQRELLHAYCYARGVNYAQGQAELDSPAYMEAWGTADMKAAAKARNATA